MDPEKKGRPGKALGGLNNERPCDDLSLASARVPQQAFWSNFL